MNFILERVKYICHVNNMTHTTLVHVHVKPENSGAFLTATLQNQQGARKEPGNVRFDVLQDAEDPLRFYLYEVYTDAEAAGAHKLTPHYLVWKETVADMMAEPRSGQPLHFHGEG
jgi:autoinducer 2-degrading protein